MKKIFLPVLLLLLLLLFSACSKTQNQLINNPEEISKYVKIIDCYIEKASGENTITSNSTVAVKFQNISDKIITGVFLSIDYLDKEGKSIGSVLMSDMLKGKVFIPPNHIEVSRQGLWLGNPKPEDIYGKEWNGSIRPHIAHIWITEGR